MNDKREDKKNDSEKGISLLVAGAAFVAVILVASQTGRAVRSAEDAKFLSAPSTPKVSTETPDPGVVVVTPEPDRFDRERPDQRLSWAEPAGSAEKKKGHKGFSSRSTRQSSQD